MSDPIRLYYWPAPNFGDALSHLVVEHVSGRAVVNARPKQAELFALGSLMHVISKHWTDRSVGDGPLLWGTGVLNPFWRKDFLENVRVRLLRGPISAAFLRLKMNEFGDPGLLAPEALPKAPAREDKITILPHHSQMEDPRFVDMVERDPALHLVDVRLDPVTVCHEIASSAHVFSASLHGLIVADAYGVGNTWMDPDAQGRLKYHDYAASIGRDMIAPVEIADVPAVARAVKDTPLPYTDGIARCRDSLLRHFPHELRADMTEAAQ
ncbi:polysaccharide pyruvyl transferase family protein [Hasllibacter sp. MH4015]|uniref:polysaccharide pyruvyl transferase family protein n=1 Tax=Hasllibacter sp. MH4015 TaxID=2854029 RepID=UPI001CD2A294|nr:polysaccharide pyruvyl transferase family protein [Hasllibacter sp. MH4015]